MEQTVYGSIIVQQIKDHIEEARRKIYDAVESFRKSTGQEIKEIILHKGDLGFGSSTILHIELPIELKL